MANGILNIWEAGAYTEPSEEYGDGLVAQIELYPGSDFNCIEWNPKKRELLATGGSSVLIVNTEKSIDEPEVIPPNTKKDTDPITDVAWNPTAPHILASVSAGGLVNVWDLKGKKSFCNFRDKSGETGRDPKISWNPSSASHLAVVFDHGKEVGVQIWDLRNTKVPVSVLKDNHKNARLNGVDWVSTNPQLILSSNRAGLVSVEHSKTNGAPIYQYQSPKDVVDVKWADRLESIFAVVDVEGGISVQTTDTEMVKKISTTHAPKWMKNTSAVAAVNGSKGALFFKDGTQSLSQVTLPGKENGIKREIAILAEMVDANDHASLCEHYAHYGGDLWRLLGSTTGQSFKGESREESQEKVLAALGFNYDEILDKTENATGKSHRKKKNTTQTQRRQSGARDVDFDLPEMTEDQAEKFFNQGHADDEASDQAIVQGDYYSNDIQEQEVRTVRNENWDAGLEDLIRRNLMIGNFHGAVDCAIKAGRFAHAFLIAYAKKDSPELLDLAAEGISMLNNDNISSLLQNMIEDKIQDTIESYDLSRWRELTAFILSNYPEEKNALLKQLAGRLQQKSLLEDAICLCLLADDFESVEDMISSIVENPEGVTGVELEKLLIRNYTILLGIQGSRSQKSSRREIQDALIQFAHILIDYSEPKLALYLLKELGDPSYDEIAFLESCIYYSHQSSLSLSFEAPSYSTFEVNLPNPSIPQRNTKAKPTGAVPVVPGKASSEARFRQGPTPPAPGRPGATTDASSRTDADAYSLVSDIDTNNIKPRVAFPPVAPTPGMPKRSGPTKTGPPPPPTRLPPAAKSEFENKSTEEVVEKLSQEGVQKRAGPAPPRPGPPAPKQPTPAGPPKPVAGPPPVVSPPKPAGVPPPAKLPAPVQPEPVQTSAPVPPPRPAAPAPPRPAGPPPPAAPAPPKAAAPPPRPAPQPPAAPVQPAPQLPVSPPAPVATPPPRAGPPAPAAPARPGPPPPGPRPGPPPAPAVTQPPRPAGPPPAQPAAPPKVTAGPPPPAGPPKVATPPPARPGAGVPPPRAAGPPPRGPPPSKTPAQQQQPEEEEVDVNEEVVSGFQNSAEFIADFVKGPELDMQRNAINQIINEVRAGKAKPVLVNLLFDFFNYLGNDDLRNATSTLAKIKPQTAPKDAKWVKAIETVLNNYSDGN